MSLKPLLARTLVAIASAALLLSTAAAAPRRGAAVAAPASEAARERARAGLKAPDEMQLRFAPSETVMHGSTTGVAGSAMVNFADLARQEALLRLSRPAPAERMLISSELNESEAEAPDTGPPAFAPSILTPPPLNIASPAPSTSFQGLDDIAMVDSSYIIIPPDVGGGVGPTKVMDTFNNNYRIQDKTTGATLLTLGTATFWNPVVTNKALLNQLTDPRTTYDPIQGRWIVCMQTTNATGLILFGVSTSSDPAGSWFLYAVTPGFTSAPRLDFPIIGFNKNWLVVTINAYTSAGAFSRGGTMIANYPQAAAGTLSSVTNVTQASGGHFCTAPCVTLSATEDTLYLVTHLSSGSATFVVDRITGTAAAPTYTTGTTTTRTGGGWVQPSGNLLPQSNPNSGVSACAPACLIETADAQVRSAPTFRVDATTGRQFIYYTQNVGLPSTGQTHTGIQWTKLTASTTAPTVADGGRIEDATATATNGGKWYSHSHIAVNSLGDFIVGYSQFSSAQHPSAGYSYHHHVDGLGTMRDPLIYKAGEDYYHKDFGSGRNRWGDFSTAQVDPTDDQTLWVLQEYGKTRTSTDDGTTGANGSKWSTYWAAVAAANTFPITASAGAGGSISPSGSVPVNQGGTQAFTITANSCFAISAVLVDGVGQGAISTFTFTNVQAAHTISATFSALGPYAITASAGPNGSISPNGVTSVTCGASQIYTITPNNCYSIASVLVDGVSQGAISTFTFTNVQAAHTISASFTINGPFTITASSGANGSVTPTGPTVVTCGGSQPYSIVADPCYHIASVLVDGVSQGAISAFTFTNVQANHTISATFAINTYTITASAGPNGTISPNGVTTLNCAANQSYAITPNSGYYLSSLIVDGSSVTPASPYAFTNVQANHTIAASFALDVATIAGTSSTSVLCPTNTCVTIPVTLARNGGTPVLGYSVTFQLSANLDLCLGTASITEGSFLNASGGTLFNVINHGGGLYTVDDALTANCGPTGTSGTLFSIGVKSSVAGGTGSITITLLKLRDCSNASLSTAAGPPATVPIDTAPVSVAAVSTPQAVMETNLLTITPGVTLTTCATGPVTWSVSPALPSGASLSTSTGVITWTPACGTASTYGPFTLTATAASGGAATTNPFTIIVSPKTYTIVASAAAGGSINPNGNVTVNCGANQPFAIAADPCISIADVLVDGVSVGAVSSYTFSNVTAGHTIAASFVHVAATVGPPTALTATQVLTGNPPGDRTGITIQFTPPGGASSSQVYRAGYGQYPEYDDNGGAPPTAPTTWPPPAPWTLTAVTASGGIDIPPVRDYWYYAAYAFNGCGDASLASNSTSGTLGYHLGDVTDGYTLGLGDNLVSTADISLLGAHYGITLAANDPFDYLDVGATTTTFVDGRPLTDDLVGFEDMVMFAINYAVVSAPARPADATPLTAAASNRLVLESPDQVALGTTLKVRLNAEGTGEVQAMSIRLSWDPAVVQPVGQEAGELLTRLNGVAFSAKPGTVDAAVLGRGQGLKGTGALASVTFKAIANGDPKIRIDAVDARDTHNRPIVVAMSRELLAPELPKVTMLNPAMPNPFRHTVALGFSLSHGGPAELSIYSVDGRRVRTLVSGTQEAGNYRYTWDGRDDSGYPMAAGVFYVHFVAGPVKTTRVITYLK